MVAILGEIDTATVAVVTAMLAFAGTIYAAVTGFKTSSASVSREDWDATLDQARQDRAELRASNDELRATNAQLVSTSQGLASDNHRLHVDVNEMKTEMADLRHGLARALEHVENCESELRALRGGDTS